VLFAWVLKRSALTWDEARRILLAACAALWVGLAIGLFDYARRAEMYLELPSVGHVNQSALYIALLAAATYAWTLQRGFASARERWFVGLSAVVFGASLLITGSRAALLGYGAFVAAFTLAWLLFGPAVDARARRFALGVIAAAAVLVGGLLSIARFLPADPVQVTIGDKLTDQRSMPIRMTHWRLAYEGWRARPWLGHGPDSFRTLRPEQACQWRAQRGQDCDPAAYASTAHAHSLYLATLAERGTLGLLALLLLFGTWGWTLLQSMRREIASPLWAASAVALAVVAVGGSFNTTLRVEHGSLALALLALWLAVRRRAAGG
jgi:O-antigen ligase